MRNIWKSFVIVCALLPALSAQAEGRIVVNGEGRVEIAPDMATISLGVTTEAKTAKDALDLNNKATASLLERVNSAGVASQDVQTNSLSLSPNWARNNSDGTSSIVGYIANNQVTLRVRNLQLLGELLDDVVSTGANTFNGLTFGLQDSDPIADLARRKAVADAKRKAKLFAEEAGVTLGSVAEISETTASSPTPMFRQSGALMEAAVPIAEGEVSVTASVVVIFVIAD